MDYLQQRRMVHRASSEKDDYVDFGRLFPDLAKQIGWSQGVRLTKQGLSDAISATRKLPGRGAISSILVLSVKMGDSLRLVLPH